MLDKFKNYKVEVKEFLANDPTLLQEIEHDAGDLRNKTQSRHQSGYNVVSFRFKFNFLLSDRSLPMRAQAQKINAFVQSSKCLDCLCRAAVTDKM
jgi:hypothetical protein